ncbi:MAG: DUF2284 domain-containing protein [Clostridia bacterium]|nr:DUF2284 domain-containing protein [Clostridia bacterium]
MANNSELFDRLAEIALSEGAYKAAVIDASLVETDEVFRALCESNACGMYGRCWMCPPDVGEIEDLMAEIHTFDHVLVYQTIGELEDSYDVEGMGETAKAHTALTLRLTDALSDLPFSKKLHLSKGGCQICPVCTKVQGKPCRFPDRAIPSLEAYGVNVSKLATSAGMKYVNGQNTVTYFGALFFNL